MYFFEVYFCSVFIITKTSKENNINTKFFSNSIIFAIRSLTPNFSGIAKGPEKISGKPSDVNELSITVLNLIILRKITDNNYYFLCYTLRLKRLVYFESPFAHQTEKIFRIQL